MAAGQAGKVPGAPPRNPSEARSREGGGSRKVRACRGGCWVKSVSRYDSADRWLFKRREYGQHVT